MKTNIPVPTDIGLQIADLITPFLSMMVAIIVALWIKDYATQLAKGLSFKHLGPFKEGDHVIIDGDKAVVVKIGASMTVFGINNKFGYMWRYVPNTKIANAKLGKLIFDNSPEENKEKIEENASKIEQLSTKPSDR